jgi:threonine dehydrogenase-like Zn-dependent dehydrogenase
LQSNRLAERWLRAKQHSAVWDVDGEIPCITLVHAGARPNGEGTPAYVDTHAIVIGAGVIGLAIARALATHDQLVRIDSETVRCRHNRAAIRRLDPRS